MEKIYLVSTLMKHKESYKEMMIEWEKSYDYR